MSGQTPMWCCAICCSRGRHSGLSSFRYATTSFPALVLADAIAARYAWPILRSFFALDAYPARGLGDHATDHDRVGWEVFLQELWGCPEAASEGVFYDPTASLAESGVKAVAGRAAIEVSSQNFPPSTQAKQKCSSSIGSEVLRLESLDCPGRVVSVPANFDPSLRSAEVSNSVGLPSGRGCWELL